MSIKNTKMLNNDIRIYDNYIQIKYSGVGTFIPNEEIYLKIKTLTSICPKLVLAGSVSLHVLGIHNFFNNQRPIDLDFGLLEPLTEEEFLMLRGFFELESRQPHDYDFDIGEDNVTPVSDILKQELIGLIDPKTKTKIDIFNKNYLGNFKKLDNNLYPFNFGDNNNPHIVYVQHPSITISYKMRYAFMNKYAKRHKHYNDCIDLICKEYHHCLDKSNELDRMKHNFYYDYLVNFGKYHDE